MNKALICIKPPGLGDANILLSNIHHISQKINKPLTILAQKSTGARAIFKHDPHVNDVIDLGKRDFYVRSIRLSTILYFRLRETIYKEYTRNYQEQYQYHRPR